MFSSESVEAPEDSKCWQPAVIIIRSTNHKWPYKLSLSIHCKFHQSYHFSLAVTSVLTTPGSHTVGRSRLTSCVLGEGHQNQKVERPLRFVSTLSHSKVMYHIPWCLFDKRDNLHYFNWDKGVVAILYFSTFA